MNSKNTKRALVSSALAMLVCVAMLVGTTFAWFTDTASTSVNKIQSGKLDVDIVDATTNETVDTLNFTDVDGKTDILWEPGVTFNTTEFKVANKGTLALKYKLVVNGVDGDEGLFKVIKFSVISGESTVALDTFVGHLKAGETTANSFKLSANMDEAAGNDYMNKTLSGVSVTVVATQDTVESDSINNTYDANATYPEYTVDTAAAFVNAAKEGGVITVAKDVDLDETVVANGTAVVDLNGKTVANTNDVWDVKPNDWSLISAQNGANLTVSGNGTLKAKENDCYAVDVQDGSTVTIKDGTFIGNIHAVYVQQGTAIIEGGFYSVQQKYPDASKADEFVLNCYDANREAGTAKIIVTGGTFVNFNPADCYAEGAHTNFVADGYKVVSEVKGSDTYYTVVAK